MDESDISHGATWIIVNIVGMIQVREDDDMRKNSVVSLSSEIGTALGLARP